MPLNAPQLSQFVSTEMNPKLTARDTELHSSLSQIQIVRTSGENLAPHLEQSIAIQFERELQPRADIIADAYAEVLADHHIVPNDKETEAIKNQAAVMFAAQLDQLVARCNQYLKGPLSDNSTALFEGGGALAQSHLGSKMDAVIAKVQAKAAKEKSGRRFDINKIVIGAAITVALGAIVLEGVRYRYSVERIPNLLSVFVIALIRRRTYLHDSIPLRIRSMTYHRAEP
jgi:hypothetical protein